MLLRNVKGRCEGWSGLWGWARYEECWSPPCLTLSTRPLVSQWQRAPSSPTSSGLSWSRSTGQPMAVSTIVTDKFRPVTCLGQGPLVSQWQRAPLSSTSAGLSPYLVTVHWSANGNKNRPHRQRRVGLMVRGALSRVWVNDPPTNVQVTNTKSAMTKVIYSDVRILLGVNSTSPHPNAYTSVYTITDRRSIVDYLTGHIGIGQFELTRSLKGEQHSAAGIITTQTAAGGRIEPTEML